MKSELIEYALIAAISVAVAGVGFQQVAINKRINDVLSLINKSSNIQTSEVKLLEDFQKRIEDLEKKNPKSSLLPTQLKVNSK